MYIGFAIFCVQGLALLWDLTATQVLYFTSITINEGHNKKLDKNALKQKKPGH
jgi:hypothetical protein